jgi:hypothetical protein
VTLGGRRVGVDRPRVRSADGTHEVALQIYAHFADRDPLTRLVLERMLAGVSTRRYVRVLEPVGAAVEETAGSTSKSSVSRAFVDRDARLWQLGSTEEPSSPLSPHVAREQRRILAEISKRHRPTPNRQPGKWPTLDFSKREASSAARHRVTGWLDEINPDWRRDVQVSPREAQGS